MNTTAAALQAHVTVATIRTWCRHGVVAAVKQADRWIIDTASLAARITIGAMKRSTREETAPMLDLITTYTYNSPDGDSFRTVTVTPTVKTRTRKNGSIWTTITGLAPFFDDRLASIADDGDRIHAAIILESSQITFTDQTEDQPDEIINGIAFLDRSRLRVKRQATREIPMQDVIDLAKQLRAQLSA